MFHRAAKVDRKKERERKKKKKEDEEREKEAEEDAMKDVIIFIVY